MSSPATVLVVEARSRLGRTIAEQLTADGFRVELARTAEHARALARNDAPTIAVIGDLEAPRGAIDLLEEIRRSRGAGTWDHDLPAIVVGAAGHQLEALRAFDAGADDFMPRPAAYLELRARLRAIIRRAAEQRRSEDTLEIAELTIEPKARIVRVDGVVVELRRMEFALLCRLAIEPRSAVARAELLSDVWGYPADVRTRTLDTHACRLRRRLQAHSPRRWVISVWGVGYRLL